jgi:ppGpp synthetase/RelA/SpoT-type nucleotidyltranferase
MPNTYSGNKVHKAGKHLIGDDKAAHDEALEVLSYWRFSHEKPLENALKILREAATAKDKNAVFAKRLKRYRSIAGKLERFPDMSLKTMQDLGGCRAIVSTTKQVKQIVRELKKRPEFKNSLGKVRFKDYLEKPKNDGYRGYHLVGKFPDGSGEKRNIELQIRTKLQHDWATTLEVVELFTGQALKSNRGREEWQEFFKDVSTQFAIMEKASIFLTLSPSEKLEAYGRQLLTDNEDIEAKIVSCLAVKSQASKLYVRRDLEAYRHSLKVTDEWLQESSMDGYVLLEVDTSIPEQSTVTGSFYSKEDIIKAEKDYTDIEKSTADTQSRVVALLATTAVGGIREAYPNYFADSTDFLEHLQLIIDAPVSHPSRTIFANVVGLFRGNK